MRGTGYGVRGAECGVRSAVNAHVGGTENDRIRTRAVSQADGRAKSGHRTQSIPGFGRKTCRKPVGNHTGCRAEDVSGTGRETHRPSSGNAGQKMRRAPDGRLYEHKAANRNRHRTQAERIAHRTSCGRHSTPDIVRKAHRPSGERRYGHRTLLTTSTGRKARRAAGGIIGRKVRRAPAEGIAGQTAPLPERRQTGRHLDPKGATDVPGNTFRLR